MSHPQAVLSPWVASEFEKVTGESPEWLFAIFQEISVKELAGHTAVIGKITGHRRLWTTQLKGEERGIF